MYKNIHTIFSCTKRFLIVPKQFLIEVVKRLTILVNSILRKDGIDAEFSPREIITGKKLDVPGYEIRQYVQGHVKTTNDAEEERSVNALYLDPADNRCGHTVFKLQIKQPISVPRVTLIPITDNIID